MRAILKLTSGIGGALLLSAIAAGAAVIDIPLKVIHAKGDVTDGTGRLLKDGDRLKTGDTIRTGQGSWAALVWVAEDAPKGKPIAHSLLRLEAASELTVTRLVEAQNEPGDPSEPYRVVKLELKRGSFAAAVRKIAAGKIEFKTPNTLAETRGAVFQMDANGSTTMLSGDISSKITLPGGKTTRLASARGQEYKLTPKILSELENGSLTPEELRALAPASKEELTKLADKLTAAVGTAGEIQIDLPDILTPDEAAKKKKKKRR